MKIERVLAAMLGAAALGGCAVTSEQPLFAVEQAPRHPLKDGLWAITGPGCEVSPSPSGQALPECAGMTMTIAGARMSWELIGAPATGVSAEQLKLMTRTAPSATDFVVIDGDPAVIEELNDIPPEAGRPPGAAKPQVGYNALRVLETDSAGRIVRGVMWPIPCPDDPKTPGFKAPSLPSGLGGQGACRAETAEAVKAQARHMKPFLSFFVTWIR